MEKYIGRVKLNYDKYPGQDLYSDGRIEDKLLSIVQQYSEEELNEVIAKEKSWPVFYHLSDLRQNIIEWFPINGEQEVLELGSGCGAITGALARKARRVTCVDLSEKRSLINAYRNREYDNIEIMLGNFEEIEKTLPRKYDIITLIGVLEYGGLYIHSKTPYLDFLKIARGRLKEDGCLLIAIENKYGLKYFAGCKEDHVARYFAGLQGYAPGDNVMTFSRDGLKKLISDAGFSDTRFYYPYPDYKFATTLYSDEYLPKAGELVNNMRNFDMERMALFNEGKVFDQIVADGLFAQFSNSFMAECHI